MGVGGGCYIDAYTTWGARSWRKSAEETTLFEIVCLPSLRYGLGESETDIFAHTDTGLRVSLGNRQQNSNVTSSLPKTSTDSSTTVRGFECTQQGCSN